MEKKKPNIFRILLGVLFVACVIVGGVKLASGLWVNVLYLVLRTGVTFSSREAYSIGVIGGADGPTAIFVTTPVWTSYLFYAVLLIIGICGLVCLRRRKGK